MLLRLDVRPAGRLCRCKHNKTHLIVKGAPRLVVKDPGPATPEYGYCAACAGEMLGQVQADLDALLRRLGS